MNTTFNDELEAINESDEITELSIKTIEIYQIQGQFVDRIWAYFNQYSAMLILMGLGVVVFRDTELVRNIPSLVAIVPGVAYILFSYGNYRTLSFSMDELFVFRNIAIAQTRLQFRGSSKGGILRFHLILMLISFWIYFGSWLYIWTYASKLPV